MLPTQPRSPPRLRRSTTPAAAAPPHNRPHRPPGRRGSGRRGVWSRPRTWIILVLVLILLWVVYTVAVPLFTWTKVEKIAFEPEGERPDDQPGTTYLMVGSDSRAGLTEEERKEFGTGNPRELAADTIMMLHTGSGPDVLLSFPRDWMVESGTAARSTATTPTATPRAGRRRSSSRPGSGSTSTSRSGSAVLPGWSTPWAGSRSARRRRSRTRKAGLDIKKGCQEADGEVALGLRPHAGHDPRRPRPGRPSARGGRSDRRQGALAVVGDQPGAVVAPQQRDPRLLRVRRGHRPDRRRPVGARDGQDGDGGLTCTMPITDGSATTADPERGEPLFDAIIEDRTDDITKAQCTRAAAEEAPS